MIDQVAAEKAVDWMRDSARQIAQARAERIYMEAWVKTVKATIQSEQAEMSVAAAEIVALSSPRYMAALEALKQAVEADEYLRWLATAAEAKVEFWRSSEATRRAEGRATS